MLLSLIICSSVAGECMPPFDWHEMFDTKYDCLHFGYNEAINKLEEIGKKDINQYGMYIKFTCTPISTIWQYGRIVVKEIYLLTITYPFTLSLG